VSAATRRVLLWGFAAAVAVGLTIIVGRAENAHQARIQSRGFERVIAAAGKKWPQRSSGYRLTPAFACLLYSKHYDSTALELCFDPKGRVVEAADRRRYPATFWTLRFDPGASHVRFGVRRLVSILRRLGAPVSGTAVPLGADEGPHVRYSPPGCHIELNSDDYEVVLGHVHSPIGASTLNSAADQIAHGSWFGSRQVGVNDYLALSWFCSREKALAFARRLVRGGFPERYGVPPPRIERHPRLVP
jgi:hypothetical protein